MIGIALSWMRGNWQTVIVGIAILALAIWIGALKFALGSAKGEIATLNGQILEWQSKYSVLDAQTARQNAQIAQNQAESDEKRKAVTVALAKAKKRATEAQKEADWLRGQLANPTDGKTCSDAFANWRNK